MKAVLFDLDGTLLPMDQEVFTKTYFHDICKKMISYGYEPESLSKGIWAGTAAMVCNNGEDTNENVFWQKFKEIFGEKDTQISVDLMSSMLTNLKKPDVYAATIRKQTIRSGN